MKKYAKVGMAVCVLMSMWGILYPELYLNPEVIRVVAQDGTTVCADSPSAYVGFLDANEGEITVRWKFMECLEQYLHAENASETVSLRP